MIHLGVRFTCDHPDCQVAVFVAMRTAVDVTPGSYVEIPRPKGWQCDENAVLCPWHRAEERANA